MGEGGTTARRGGEKGGGMGCMRVTIEREQGDDGNGRGGKQRQRETKPKMRESVAKPYETERSVTLETGS